MTRFLFLSLSFVSVMFISGFSYAQDESLVPKERTVADDLLECSIFYETHGALMARNNKSSKELWDKSDHFKRSGIEQARSTKALTSQEIDSRISYLVKKWSKRLLSSSRPRHKQNADLRNWTRFCDALGENENILPLQR